MRKFMKFSLVSLLLCSSMTLAAINNNISIKHWAYDAIQSLRQNGIGSSCPEDCFVGNKMANRYEIAVVVADVLAKAEQSGRTFSEDEIKTLNKLKEEFKNELLTMGIAVSSIEEDLKSVKEDVAALKEDVLTLKSSVNDSNGFKFSGESTFRLDDFSSEMSGLDVHRSFYYLNLNLEKDIDEKTSVLTRWVISDNALDGKNKNANVIDKAYLTLKKPFGHENGKLIIGRDFYSHGSGLLINDTYDSVSYRVAKNNINMEYNLFFQRQPGDVDYRPGINVFFENKKNDNEKFYVDMVFTSFTDGEYKVSKDPSDALRRLKNARLGQFDIGGKGYIGKRTDLRYKLDGLISYFHDDLAEDTSEVGFAGHASINYCPKNSEFSTMLAYNFITSDCYPMPGSNLKNIYYLDYTNISYDDEYWDTGYEQVYSNLQSLRFLVKYAPRKYKKINLKFAFDHISDLNSHKPFGHSTNWRPGDVTEFKDFNYLLQCAYKITPNTTFVADLSYLKDKEYDDFDNRLLEIKVISKF